MNYRIVFKFLGIIAFSFIIFFLISLLAGFIKDPLLESKYLGSWFKVLGINLLIGLIFYCLGIHAGSKILRREGVIIIGIGWILASLLGALPYYIVYSCSFFDSFFESCSGLTTTGATVFGDFSDWPASLVFWRAFSQWIGALGVMILFVGLFSFLGTGLKFLYDNESSGRSIQVDAPNIRMGIYQVILLYFVISLLNAGLFALEGMDIWDSFCFMFGVISTGGFGVGSRGIAVFESSLIEWTTIIFMLIGGSCFYCLLRGWRFFLGHVEVKVYGCIFIVNTCIVTYWLMHEKIFLGFTESLKYGCFQVATFMTTTGFSTYNYDVWPIGVKIILIISSILGGCSGSTAAGFKMIRCIIIWRVIRDHLEKIFRPQVIRPIMMDNELVSIDKQQEALVHVIIWLFLAFFGLIIIGWCEPNLSLMGNFSSVTMALSNLGCAMAEVGPSYNFGFLSDVSKSTLAVLMLCGRLEYTILLSLLINSLWRNN